MQITAIRDEFPRRCRQAADLAGASVQALHMESNWRPTPNDDVAAYSQVVAVAPGHLVASGCAQKSDSARQRFGNHFLAASQESKF